MLRILAVFASVLALSGAGGTVMAQSPVPKAEKEAESGGYITAFACGELQTSRNFQVDTLDDSENSLRLRKAAVDALVRQKASISDTARMRLSVEYEAIQEAAVRKGRDLGEFRSAPGEEDVNLRMNVWSNERDSIIGGRRDRLEKRAIHRVRVKVSVHSKSDGTCLWQGEAEHQLDGVAEKVIPRLTAAIGKTVKRQPFEVDLEPGLR